MIKSKYKCPRCHKFMDIPENSLNKNIHQPFCYGCGIQYSMKSGKFSIVTKDGNLIKYGDSDYLFKKLSV